MIPGAIFETIKSASSDWEQFAHLCVEQPCLAFLLLYVIPPVIILQFYYLLMSVGVVAGFQDVNRSKRRRWGVAITAVWTALVTLTVVSVASKRQLRPVLEEPQTEAVHIASSMVLKWVHDTPENRQLQHYLVEYGPDEDFRKARKEKAAVEFLEFDDLEGDILWRVRARYIDGSESPWSETGRFSFYTSALSRINRTRRVTIGVTATSMEKMFAYYDDEKNEWTGFDIELVREIIKRLDIEGLNPNPDIKTAPWADEFFSLPEKGEVDLIISAICRTREREDKYDIRFSEKYYALHQSMVTLAESNIESIDQVNDKTVGALSGTTNFQLGRALTETLIPFKGKNARRDAYNALRKGAIIAFLDDKPFINKRLGGLPDAEKFRRVDFQESDLPAEYGGPVEGECAIAVAETETEFLSRINQIIKDLEREGFLERLEERFVGSEASSKQKAGHSAD